MTYSLRDVLFAYYDHLTETALCPERAGHAINALNSVFLPGISIGDASSPHGVASYTESRRRQVSDATIRRELGVLRAACQHWRGTHNLLYTFPDIKLPPPAPPKMRVLDQDEVARMLDAAQAYPHVLAFIQIALLTGQRKEAILSLTWAQVDWQRMVIGFDWAATASSDLNAIAGATVFRRKGRGNVPINSQLETVLRGLERWKRGPYVIQKSAERIRSMRHAWAKICKRAGLVDVTPHTLRHTVATNMIGAGCSLLETSRMLGHKSTRTTEDAYIKYSPEFLRGAADQVRLP